MLSAIISSIGGSLIDKLIGPFTELFKAHINKQITVEQLRTELLKVMLSTVSEIEKSHADSMAKTYATFMDAAVKTPTLMRAYVIVLYSQLFVLLWHQFGISALCYFAGNKACWPSSGTTVDWSYALVAALCGFGVVLQRMGPAQIDVGKLKAALGR
jgi:hypothetical protein